MARTSSKSFKAAEALRQAVRLLVGSTSFMVTSGSFMPIPQSLGHPVSREVGWEGALDPGRPSDYSPSRNDPEVSMARSIGRCLVPLFAASVPCR